MKRVSEWFQSNVYVLSDSVLCLGAKITSTWWGITYTRRNERLAAGFYLVDAKTGSSVCVPRHRIVDDPKGRHMQEQLKACRKRRQTTQTGTMDVLWPGRRRKMEKGPCRKPKGKWNSTAEILRQTMFRCLFHFRELGWKVKVVENCRSTTMQNRPRRGYWWKPFSVNQ